MQVGGQVLKGFFHQRVEHRRKRTYQKKIIYIYMFLVSSVFLETPVLGCLKGGDDQRPNCMHTGDALTYAHLHVLGICGHCMNRGDWVNKHCAKCMRTCTIHNP